MRMRPFQQVDVFTAQAYRGNPLAVVLDGTDLSTQSMQEFTDWTHLSEATFVLPPSPEGQAAGADYRVRIFCPGQELPFAGHPTLGTCHAWLQAGGQPRNAGRVVQECGVGLVTVRQEGDRLAFAAPPLKRGGPLPPSDLQRIARGLGVAPERITHHAWCDNGPPWQAVMLHTAADVLALRPDPSVLEGLFVGVVAPRTPADTEGASAATWEVRAFFPGHNGLAEDPVTGSLNAALAQWLIGAGLAPARYVASQGTCLGRAGRVHIERDGADLWVAGQCVTCVSGEVRL